MTNDELVALRKLLDDGRKGHYSSGIRIAHEGKVEVVQEETKKPKILITNLNIEASDGLNSKVTLDVRTDTVHTLVAYLLDKEN